MEEVEVLRMAEAESRSWWFRGRRRVLEEVLKRLAMPPDVNIADLGCGTGGNLVMLRAFGKVTGVEVSPVAAEVARRRAGVEVRCASMDATGLPDASFDVVTAFDVLEHMEDDRAALLEVWRLLKPGGRFVVTVPAFMMLWSAHDEALHHKRRYRRGPLAKALLGAGLDVEWLTYFNAALFPPVAAIRLLRRPFGGGAKVADGVEALPGPLNDLLEGVFAAERHLVGRVPLPAGVSLVGVARKRAAER